MAVSAPEAPPSSAFAAAALQRPRPPMGRPLRRLPLHYAADLDQGIISQQPVVPAALPSLSRLAWRLAAASHPLLGAFGPPQPGKPTAMLVAAAPRCNRLGKPLGRAAQNKCGGCDEPALCPLQS